MSPRTQRPPATGRLVDVDGLRIHVEDDGSGVPPLLLIHGYLSSSAVWDAARRHMARHTRAVAVDLPGGGYSERPADAPYDLPWFADRLPRLTAALGMDRPVLVGHSLGGGVALHAVDRHPEAFAGLVLVSPPVYAPPPPPGLRVASRHPAVMRRFFASRLGRAVIPRLVQRAGFAREDPRLDERVARLLGHLDAPGGWEAATRIGTQVADHAPDQALLRRVRHPCLVVWGERDRVHPPTAAPRLRDDLGGPARIVIVEGAGHNSHEERADAFAAAVTSWLAETPALSVASDRPAAAGGAPSASAAGSAARGPSPGGPG